MTRTSNVVPASPAESLEKGTAAAPSRDAGPPSYDRRRRIGGELELFVVRRGARGYRTACLTERLFRDGAHLQVPGAGHLSPEFHRDMIELNPRPCLSLQEHHARLRVLLAEAVRRRVEHRLTPAELFLDLVRRRSLEHAVERYVEGLRTDTPLI